MIVTMLTYVARVDCISKINVVGLLIVPMHRCESRGMLGCEFSCQLLVLTLYPSRKCLEVTSYESDCYLGQ